MSRIILRSVDVDIYDVSYQGRPSCMASYTERQPDYT